jgi:catechol 2,3-dioxygenase-like lactoylglutathione lyase family enzyme
MKLSSRLAGLGLSIFLGIATPENKPIETTRHLLDLTIVTNDPHKAKEFYGDILGLNVLSASGDTTRYQVGDGTIDLVSAPKPLQAYPGFESGIGISGVALYLSDADRFAKRMHDHGKAEPNFLTPSSADAKVARVTDPDGNWIELIFLKNPFNQMAIILQVADEAKSREFYGKTLGMPDAPPHGKPETGLLYAYTAGGSTVLVRGARKGSAVHTGAPTACAGFRSIRFPVKDVDAVARSLRESGVAIPVPPHDGPNGSRTMYVADPDGNYLEFVSAP